MDEIVGRRPGHGAMATGIGHFLGREADKLAVVETEVPHSLTKDLFAFGDESINGIIHFIRNMVLASASSSIITLPIHRS